MNRFRRIFGWYPDEHRLRSDKALYNLLLRRRSIRDISGNRDYTLMRRFGNIHFLPKDDAYLVIGHHEVDAILQQPDIFPRIKSSRLDPDDIIRFSDPAGYERVMNPIRSSISRSVIQDDEAFIREETSRIYDTLPRGRIFDFYRRFSMPLTWRMTMRLFGFDLGDGEAFFSKYGHDLENPGLESSLYEWCAGQLQKDDSKSGGRLLDRLKINISSGTTSQRDAVSLLLLMVHASLRTTSVSLSCMVEGLRARPGSGASQVCQDVGGIPKYMEEMWRLSPPVTRLTRYLTEPTVICGVMMLPNTRVILDLKAANRDPLHFSRPFDVSPVSNRHRHLSFSAGLHQCTGMHVARYQVRIILESLFPIIDGLDVVDSVWAETENGNSSTVAPQRQLFRINKGSSS